MALIIEDGTGVTNANSYETLVNIRAFATARGETLPTDDTELEALVIDAMDYIESFRSRFKGSKVSPTQPLQFPRNNVVIEGYNYPSNEIPNDLKKALAQAVIEANSTDLQPNTAQAIKRERVDVIEVEYQDSTSADVVFFKILNYLEVLLNTGSDSGFVRVVRV